MSSRIYYLLLLIWFGFAASTGCKSLDLKADETADKDTPWWKQDDQEPAQDPSKIVAIWSNSVFSETGKSAIRGLGGRVYFYDAKHQPVRVEGKLTVFLYDDTDKKARKRQEATKQIDFSPEEVAKNFTPSEFGASYSFWLPWDEVGSERTHLSVIPVFTSTKGEMLVGEQARYVLPGKRRIEVATERVTDGGVVPASFEAENGIATGGRSRTFSANTDTPENKLQLTTTTIKVPPSVQRRLRKAKSPVRYRRKLNEHSELRPRISDLRRSTLSTTTETQQQRTETRSARTPDAIEPPPTSTTESRPASTDFRLDPRQARTLRSAQQASARDQSVLARAKSLFSR